LKYKNKSDRHLYYYVFGNILKLNKRVAKDDIIFE